MSAGAGVAPDGSPVAVYLAAPPGDAAEVTATLAPPPATLLELGCGVGRLTRPLVGLGYDVTAVDVDEAMLAHVTGARTVRADAFAVDLGRHDVVLGASHFVDDADPAARSRLLSACARHVVADGVVLLERYDPGWAEQPESHVGSSGPVRISLEVVGVHDGVIDARLTYELPGRRWEQRFRCVAATEELVAREAAAQGLELVGVHGDDATWLELRPV